MNEKETQKKVPRTAKEIAATVAWWRNKTMLEAAKKVAESAKQDS
jgi:hypothetical protein